MSTVHDTLSYNAKLPLSSNIEGEGGGEGVVELVYINLILVLLRNITSSEIMMKTCSYVFTG